MNSECKELTDRQRVDLFSRHCADFAITLDIFYVAVLFYNQVVAILNKNRHIL